VRPRAQAAGSDRLDANPVILALRALSYESNGPSGLWAKGNRLASGNIQNGGFAARRQITKKSAAVSAGVPCTIANSTAAPAPLPSASKNSEPFAGL
jgi:hypothetical protein